ncbi:MAG: hypothetical protein K2M37_00695 [Muribaculaceae bacterium]|nr:hypothetical protein [Muribaculaceae bacterium]
MKRILQWICGSAVALAAATGMTSCGNTIWWNDPGWGYNYTDQRLTGMWQLVQINTQPVLPQNANFLEFDGSGSGYYYYYDRNREYREQLRYWVEAGYQGAYNSIDIQYRNGGGMSGTYWFTNNNHTLCLQWVTSGGRVETYAYDWTPYRPW